MDAADPLIAVIGPNESGKTSLLHAIGHLERMGEAFDTGDLTHDTQPEERQDIVWAWLALDDADREALPDIPGADDLTRFYIAKVPDGTAHYKVEPELPRSLQRRQRLGRLLVSLAKSATWRFLTERDPQQFRNADLAQTRTNLATEATDLPQPVLAYLSRLADALEAVEYEDLPEDIDLEVLVDDLRTTHAYETERPSAPVLHALAMRSPRFLRFTSDARELRQSYPMDALSGTALDNLAALAGLDLQWLRRATKAGQQHIVQQLLQDANQQLDRRFIWSQSPTVAVRLHFYQDALHVNVENPDQTVVPIAERSDGLRQFAALISFVHQAATEDRPIVLLIDEAELHLHYDAQADLVQMLARQSAAHRVIYTTHSIGCLPEDLGRGIRMLHRPQDGMHTTIVGRFWLHNRHPTPGFAPILFGLGASTLAYIPIRAGLLVEGPSDTILYPSLFREVIDARYIGFQCVPGLSWVSGEALPLLAREASRVAFLTDADQAGVRKRAWLQEKCGIDEERLFSLPDSGGNGLTIEDFVDTGLYREAVNTVWRLIDATTEDEDLSEMPNSGRRRWLSGYCDSHGLPEPAAPRVAQEVVDRVGERFISFPQRRQALRKLHRQLSEWFSITGAAE